MGWASGIKRHVKARVNAGITLVASTKKYMSKTTRPQIETLLSPILILSPKFARNIIADKPKINISNPLAVGNGNGVAPPKK